MAEFDLQKYMAAKAGLVNTALERVLPEQDGYGKNLHAAMRYSVFAGGKRLRPVLVLAAFEAAGGGAEDSDAAASANTGAAMLAACAFECVHTYSLIHDDLPAMDDDDLRRGRATCHKAFTEATAVLAGDALLTIAFELVAASPTESEKLLRVIKELTRGAGYAGMIGGQIMDIESERTEIPFALLENIHIRKTGALIVSAVRSGAVLAGATEAELKSLTTYAEAIGLAFQIADDILDIEGTDEELGKPAGSDLKHSKATYPSLVGLSESRRMATSLIETATTALSEFDEKADPLRAIAAFVVKRKN